MIEGEEQRQLSEQQYVQNLIEHFRSFPAEFAMIWLFVTLPRFDVTWAWGGSVVVALGSAVVRWWVYPLSLWNWGPFVFVKSVTLWGLCAWAAWALWREGAHAQAVLTIATRAFLHLAYFMLTVTVVDAPFALLAGVGNYQRLYFQRYHRVPSDATGLSISPDMLWRVVAICGVLLLLVGGWVALMSWVGK